MLITHAASETLKCLNTTEHASYVRVCTFLFKKRRSRLFKLYQALFICKKIAADDDGYFFVQKS